MTASVSTSVRALASTLMAALLLVLGVVLAYPTTAHAATADEDVTWTVRTESNGFGADRTSFSYAVDPGGTVEDGLVIANRGDEPLDLGVYAADGYTTTGGQLDLLPADEPSKNIGAWVHTDVDRVTVAPGESATVPFTLTIPENATPGDYAGGVVTSLVGTNESGVSVDRRLGIRISLRVGGELMPSLAVEDVHVDWNGGLNPFAGGDATVTYTLRNTGNAALAAQQAATVAGVFGWFAMDAGDVAPSPELLPGESWTESVTVAGAPPLVWLLASATATPVVTDASGSTTTLTPVVATGTGWAVPWMLLVIVLVIVALAVFVPILRRRRKAAQAAREEARVAEAVKQALSEADAEKEDKAPVGS